MGIPNDSQFQTDVLKHAFGLLTSEHAIVTDYPVNITDDPSEQLVCALPPRFDESLHPAIDEAQALRPAYDRTLANLGNRTGAGRVVDADDIPKAIAAFVKVAEGVPWKEAGIPGIPARVAQDIRGYYEMAALAIAEHTPAAWAPYRWFRDNTQTGAIIRQAQATMREQGEKDALWRFLLPLDAAAPGS